MSEDVLVQSEHSYSELPEVEKQNICQELVNSREEAKREKKFGLFVLPGSDPRSRLARITEREVFEEFFGNDAEEMSDEYGPYEQASTFLLVIDQENMEPAGVMRLMRGQYEELKTLVDLGDEDGPWEIGIEEAVSMHNIKPFGIFDIATLAAKKDYRGEHNLLVTSSLYHELYQLSEQRGVEQWLATLDNKVLEIFDAMGVPFEPVCGVESKPYLGSPASTPVIVNFKDISPSVMEKSKEVHEHLIGGKGIRETVSLPK